MPRSDPLTKHTFKLFAGDLKRLQSYYPELGASIVIRRLIRKHLAKLDAAGEAVDLNIDLEVENAE